MPHRSLLPWSLRVACGIQYCLQRNNHIQSKCEDIIAVYKTCCENAKAIEQEQLQQQQQQQEAQAQAATKATK